jgi:GNAT superfamily N-acetyltransferase
VSEYEPVFADIGLAHRIESSAAADLRRLVDAVRRVRPDLGAEHLDVGGGAALWLGPGFSVNQTLALGFEGPVVAADLAAVESFFAAHSEPTSINVCPLAEEGLLAALKERGYAIREFENVLALPLGDLDVPRPDPALPLAVASTAEEKATWAATLVQGYAGADGATEMDRVLGEAVAARDDVVKAYVELGDVPVATGSVAMSDGLAWLYSDATLHAYRGRGAQTALQRLRVRLAKDEGCDIAVTEAEPGSGSQRNMERLGFRVVYTRVLVESTE